MVAYESTVDQTDRESEVEIMNSNDVTAAYEEYNKKLGSGIVGAPPVMPHPDEELTIEQLTALRALVASDAPPSVDFSVWRPHANRHKKILALHGLHIGLDGAIVLAEIKGPANIEEWLASWRIVKVACLMLKMLSTAAADTYSGHIFQATHTIRIPSLAAPFIKPIFVSVANTLNESGGKMMPLRQRQVSTQVSMTQTCLGSSCTDKPLKILRTGAENLSPMRCRFVHTLITPSPILDRIWARSQMSPSVVVLVEMVAAAQAHNGSRHRRVSDPKEPRARKETSKARTDRGSIPKEISWRIMGGRLCASHI